MRAPARPSLRERARRLRVPSAWALLVLALSLVGPLGCGKKGPPVPPEPRGPEAPRRLSVRQIGSDYSVNFELPAPRGPRPQQQLVRAELLRVGHPPGFVPPPDPEAFARRGTPVGEADLSGLDPGSPVTIGDPTADQIEGGGLGWTLRYAVRILDQRGRPSLPVAASDLKPLPAGVPPVNLSAVPSADGIRLKWDPPPIDVAPTGSSAAGEETGGGSVKKPQYNLYRARFGEPFPERPLSTSALTEPEYLDGRIVTGERYVYVVRALLETGRPVRESAPSDPVEVEAWDRFAPAAPTGVVAVQEGAAVRLFWNPNREPDLAGYRVYRRVDGGDWAPIGPDLVEQPTLIDTDVNAGQSVEYHVTAVDRAERVNESEPAETRPLVVATEHAVPGGQR